jgi:cytochrome c biogenesis protein CcdA
MPERMSDIKKLSSTELASFLLAGAALLLALYSVGLALPFLALAAVADRSPAALQRILSRLRGGTRIAGIVGGLLVAAIGILIATGGLTLLSRIMPGLPGL